MSQKLNINIFYENEENTILEILEQDFKDFLNDYTKNTLSKDN